MTTTDVFLDFSCPWSYIAHHRLAAADHGNGSWRSRAYQLNPDISADGLARTTYRTNKFGSLAESQRRDGVVVDAARSAGLDIDFDSIDVTPNTRNAHRAMKATERRGGDTVALAEAIFEAYFGEGRDIGDTGELIEIARGPGVELLPADFATVSADDDQVSFDIDVAHRAGLTGVPFFVADADTDPRPITTGAAIAALTRASR